MAENFNLESLLDRLYTDASRASLILELSAKMDMPKSLIERGILDFEKKNYFYGAAQLAEKLGIRERARELYEKEILENEKRGEFMRAGDIAKEAGMLERAIKAYEKAEGHLSEYSAEIALKLEMPERARELYEKAIQACIKGKDYEEASEIALDAGMQERAVDILELGKDFREAADIAKEAGLKKRARELSEKAIAQYEDDQHLFGLAAEIALENEMIEKAVTIYEKNNKILKAAEIADRHGMKERARRLYESELETKIREHKYEDAIDIANKAGMHEKVQALAEKLLKVLSKYEPCPLFIEAEIAEKAGLLEKARELRQQNLKEIESRGSFGIAVERARELGYKEKADFYETIINFIKSVNKNEKEQDANIESLITKIESPEARASLVMQVIGKTKIPSGHIENAINFYESKENYETAAEISKEAGLEEKALRLFNLEIEKDEKNNYFYGAASTAKKAGMLERAIQNYERDGNSFYLKEAVELAEKAGLLEKARELRETIMKMEIEEENFEGAAEAAKKIGLFEDAKRLYEKAISKYEKDNLDLWNLKKAAELAVNLGEEKAREIQNKYIDRLLINERDSEYDRRENKWKAAKYAMEVGIKEKAQVLYLEIIKELEENKSYETDEEYKRFENIIRAAAEADMPELLKEYNKKYLIYLEETGQFEVAERIAEKSGLTGRTELYKEINKLLDS